MVPEWEPKKGPVSALRRTRFGTKVLSGRVDVVRIVSVRPLLCRKGSSGSIVRTRYPYRLRFYTSRDLHSFGVIQTRMYDEINKIVYYANYTNQLKFCEKFQS